MRLCHPLTSGSMFALWEGWSGRPHVGQEPLARRDQGPETWAGAHSVLPHYQLRLPTLEVCEHTSRAAGITGQWKGGGPRPHSSGAGVGRAPEQAVFTTRRM